MQDAAPINTDGLCMQVYWEYAKQLLKGQMCYLLRKWKINEIEEKFWILIEKSRIVAD